MTVKKALIVLLLITVASFLPAISADFVNWDDDAHIMKNSLVQNFSFLRIPDVFLKANSANSTYIPLTTLTWGIEYSLFGKNPLVFHLTNLFLHIGVVVVVYFLAARFGLGAWGAFAAALLFAIHPSRVENVAWVTARKDLLYGLFYLLSIGAYLRYLEFFGPQGKAPRRQIIFYFAALGFGLLSIFAKPMAVSLPWVLWLVDWMKRRKFSHVMLLDKLPFLFLILPIAWITYEQNSREIVLDFPNGFLVWFWSAAFYIHKFIWPGVMSPVYALPEPVEIANPAYWQALVILTLTGFILWRKSSNRWLIFAFAFYFLTSFFLWRFDWRDISVVADRFLYIPGFAACLALGRLVEYFLDKKEKLRRLAIGAFLAVVAACAVGTFTYTFAWRDGFALWNSVAEYSPDLAFAYNNRGALYVTKKNNSAAMRDFNKAIEVASRSRIIKDGKPLLPAKAASQYASSHFNIGLMHAKEKDYEEALKRFNLAIYYDVEKAEYYNNRGATLMKFDRKPEALSDYNAALAVDPDFYEARINRGLFYYKNGQKDDALADFLKAVKIDSTLADGYLQAGRIYFERDELTQALKMFEAVIKEEPDHAQALYNIGMIQLKMGDKEKAQQSFSQAQVKWLKDPEKYVLPGLNPSDAKLWAERVGK